MNERLLRLPEVLHHTGLSRSELYRQVASGRFPKAVPISERLRAWRDREIQSWIAQRVAERDNKVAA
jgi:prophage regulatory protein